MLQYLQKTCAVPLVTLERYSTQDHSSPLARCFGADVGEVRSVVAGNEEGVSAHVEGEGVFIACAAGSDDDSGRRP